MTRCVSDKLHKLFSNTRYPISSRKLLCEKTKNISMLERLVKGVKMSIKNNANNCTSLKEDLANAPYHVPKRHSQCRNSFCNRENNDVDVVEKVDTDFFIEIKKILEPLISKADRCHNKSSRKVYVVGGEMYWR
ncbi:hypothetical protein AMK59_6353 [Oryctes borbonicus]|uniref:Uncharacterized protein n=1 Tax=Oryctes borbonicus TaxID=1629725 RepID=A0A0T6B032_9SCAR|nr:hypothetical protein AMK59_6353 [Oryctes borbonicus]